MIRKIAAAIPSTVLGILYAGSNAFLGIRYQSAWYGTFAGYFLLLTSLRLLLLHGCRRKIGNFAKRELQIYMLCGMLLSILSITLTSLLCLQTGLLNAFGGGDAEYAMRMNGITGGFVSLAALVMGLSMMIGGWKRRKTL